VTVSTSLDSTSVPQLVKALGKASASGSQQTPENSQSALPPLNPSPRDGLRRRTTARCDCFLPVFTLTLSIDLLYFLVFQSHSAASFSSTNPPTLAQVLEPMSSFQVEFFNKLNAELSKIESFFIERESEARVRSLQLRGQLEELKDHRRLFHVTWSYISSFARY
jgi:SPX domain